MLNKIILLLVLGSISLTVNAGNEFGESPDNPPTQGNPDRFNNEGGPGQSICEDKWMQYMKSQECFAPYRNANGSIKAEAFKHCVEVKYPADCPIR